MSGPKTSQYTLTPEQRRIIMEQRKIRMECELLIKQQRDIRSIVVQADQVIEQIEPLMMETGSDTGVVNQAKALRSEAMTVLNSVAQMNSGNGLMPLQNANRKIGEVSGKLAAITSELKKEFTSADKAFRTEMTERISEGFNISFDNLGEDDDLQNNDYYRKIEADLASLSDCTISEELEARMQIIREKANEIDDIGFLKNFCAMTVSPFVKECRTYHDAYTAYGEEYERKRFIYETNAQMLGVTAEHVPFSAEAVSILDTKIRETENAILFREEQAYISHCVDEAMQEMGYSVLGNRDVVRRNGKKFHNELYLFDEGTAVNVTYSSDGQITMELGGLGKEDRIPTDAESTSLVSDMRTFCDDYYEIERRLRKKGIVTKRISILPPEEQFAQIINVSDYDLCADVSAYEARKEKKQVANVRTQKIGE